MITFANRLRHTIAQLKQETADGVENWTATIDRLQATLLEEERNEAIENAEPWISEPDPADAPASEDNDEVMS